MYVIIRLRDGSDVIGIMSILDENSIMLSGALSVRFGVRETGPAMYLEKYSLFNESFDVAFLNKNIDHVFRDPLPAIIEFYNKHLIKMKKRYKAEMMQELSSFNVDDPDEEPEINSTIDYFKTDGKIH